MAKMQVLVPIADDSEEIETACITDTLVRAGAEVTVASVSGNLQVKMSRGLKILADCLIADCADKEWDAIACPGGMPGAERLRDCEPLTKLLKAQAEKSKVTAAMCASPAVIFATHGLLPKSATCYPAQKFKDVVGEAWQDKKAVIDGHVITSQGPGTSLQFALQIVEKLYSLEKAQELAGALLTSYP
jgi:4-methyl-5(b-hydroxyethyl)-thiazole monophosphate biosynthesis